MESNTNMCQIAMWLAILLLKTCASSENIANVDYSLQLLYRISIQNNKNFVISPFGVWTIVNCIAESVDNKTYDTLSSIFHLPKIRTQLYKEYKDIVDYIWNVTDSSVSFVTDNYFFFNVKSTIDTNYLTALTKVYQVTLAKVVDYNDPEIVSAINTDIQGTQPLADYKFSAFKREDFKSSNKLTASITFFHGVWSTRFTGIRDEEFFNDNGEAISTLKMMHKIEHIPYASFSREQFDVIELTYGVDGKYSMVIFLPHNGTYMDELRDQILTIDLRSTLNIIRRMENDDRNYLVDIKIPKFKMTTNVALIDYLSELGASVMFSNAPESVANIRHKALFTVTEHGTTGAPETDIRRPTIKFHCNRPFMFLVIDVAKAFVIIEGMFENPGTD